MRANYPGIKLVRLRSLGIRRETFSRAHVIHKDRSFQFVYRNRTAAKCSKLRSGRAKRTKILSFHGLINIFAICDVLGTVVVVS